MGILYTAANIKHSDHKHKWQPNGLLNFIIERVERPRTSKCNTIQTSHIYVYIHFQASLITCLKTVSVWKINNSNMNLIPVCFFHHTGMEVPRIGKICHILTKIGK